MKIACWRKKQDERVCDSLDYRLPDQDVKQRKQGIERYYPSYHCQNCRGEPWRRHVVALGIEWLWRAQKIVELDRIGLAITNAEVVRRTELERLLNVSEIDGYFQSSSTNRRRAPRKRREQDKTNVKYLSGSGKTGVRDPPYVVDQRDRKLRR